MRVAQIADIWYSVFGSNAFNSQVVIVMAGQAANTAILVEELSTPDWTGAGNGPAANHHIGAAAIAPYFFATPGASDVTTMLAQSDGGLAGLFSTVYSQAGFSSVPTGGWIAQCNTWLSSHVTALSTYGIPIVAYEGGQALQGSPTYGAGSTALNLFITANRDARMGTAYTAYLNGWKTNGGTLFMHFNDSFPPSQYGEWGALESFMQTTSPLNSAPSKWQAIENFISANTCWWSGCTGSIGGTPSPTAPLVPMAPTNLTVQ
jgi:hypothetical protein